MANRKVLSPFSFYGGKDRMAPLICDLIDYKDTDLYIEPFGGACRVLLNKPRHKAEIYNDFGYGLCNFFETLGNTELSKEVIDTLYSIVPSEELFYQMLQYKLEHEQELTENMQKQFRKFIWNCNKKYQFIDLKKLHSAVGKREYKIIVDTMKEIAANGVITDTNDIRLFKGYSKLYNQYWHIVKIEYNKAYKEAKVSFESEWKARNIDIKQSKKEKYLHSFCHKNALEKIEHYTNDILSANGTDSDKDTIKMAVATFITYYLSRDGMGLDYSSAKNKSLNRYYDYLNNLKDIAQRFEGVQVTQADAIMIVCQYCDNENVMMYLDPSYLKPEDTNKDLGKGIYNRSSDYEEHEALAYAIQDAKAKIILSNYEVAPYTEYLDEAHGWKKLYFETNTSVGGKKDNRRTEVLWYNY